VALFVGATYRNHTRLTTPALAGGAREDWLDAWFDKAKLHGERSRTILPGQVWELEIHKAARASIIYSQEKAGNL